MGKRAAARNQRTDTVLRPSSTQLGSLWQRRPILTSLDTMTTVTINEQDYKQLLDISIAAELFLRNDTAETREALENACLRSAALSD